MEVLFYRNYFFVVVFIFIDKLYNMRSLFDKIKNRICNVQYIMVIKIKEIYFEFFFFSISEGFF